MVLWYVAEQVVGVTRVAHAMVFAVLAGTVNPNFIGGNHALAGVPPPPPTWNPPLGATHKTWANVWRNEVCTYPCFAAPLCCWDVFVG